MKIVSSNFVDGLAREVLVLWWQTMPKWAWWRTDDVLIFTRTWLRYVRVFAVAIPSVVCLSVVCNVGAPYSGGWTFQQNFFTAVYAGHPLTSVRNFTEIVLGEPLRRER